MSSISALSSATASSSWDELFSTSKSASAQKDDSLTSKLFGDLDADGSGSISLEESGLGQETYDAMDSDKDGAVSLAELETALELQRSAMFTQIKIEGDMLPYGEDGEGGKPDAQEFLVSIMDDQATGQPTSSGGNGSKQTVYDAMDTNQDGSVSPEELAAALAKQKESMGNGILSAFGASGTKSQDIFSSLANGVYNAIAQATKSGEDAMSLNVTV